MLETTTNLVTHTGNGATTVFPYAFRIDDEAYVEVTLLTIASGAVETLSLGDGDFSISGIGEDAGGNVTYNPGTPLPSTKRIVIRRVVPYTQEMDINNQTGFLPEVLEGQLDNIVMQVQQVAEEVGRSVKITAGSTSTAAELLQDIADSVTAAQAAETAAETAQAAAESAQTGAQSAETAAELAQAAAEAAAASIEGIPSGGTDGQILVKQSGTDYDIAWEDAATSAESQTNALFYELADLKGSIIYFPGGFADAFDSETGIDTATSTNESYDSGNDLYSPTVSGAETWDNSNKSSGSVISGGGLVHTGIAGSSHVSGVKGTIGRSSGKWYFELTVGVVGTAVHGISDSASINGLSTNAGYTESYSYGNSGQTNILGSASAYGASYTNGDVLGFAVDLDNGKIFYSKNGVWQGSGDPVAGTNPAATGISGTKHAYAGSYNSGSVTANFGASAFAYTPPTGFSAWGPGTTHNMTLVSNAFTAIAVPTVARIAAFIDPQVPITINTDFTAEISRDGGTTWTAIPLALVSNPVGTVEQYEGSASISSQPSGSSMKYRLKTLNNKDIDVTGIVFKVE